MDAKLLARALLKFSAGLLLTGLLVFLPAGTLRWREGWRLMAILFLPMLAAGLVMLVRSPERLRKRLSAREAQSEQRRVIALSALMFLASFVLAGLNYRFGWLVLPDAVSRIAAGIFLLGYLLYARVLRENAWLSRTVEVQADQRVVDTGLYGVVRHPMYLSTLLLFLSMPLVLGSAVSFVVMLAYIPILAARIRGEERLLERELPGYADYMKRVRCRVIPFVW